MDLTTLPEDLTTEEKKVVAEYVANGCPGLVKINDDKVFKWFELYMTGKSYTEIAHLMRENKDLIMYVACRSRWLDKRMQYYNDMAVAFSNKLKKAKVDSANTVVNAIAALSKYHNKKFNDFLTTNDQSIIDNMDTKLLGQYYKSLETLDKLVNPAGSDDPDKDKSGKSGPTVNVNVGSGATVKQIGDDTVEITTDEAAGDLLKALSNYQRTKERGKN